MAKRDKETWFTACSEPYDGYPIPDRVYVYWGSHKIRYDINKDQLWYGAQELKFEEEAT